MIYSLSFRNESFRLIIDESLAKLSFWNDIALSFRNDWCLSFRNDGWTVSSKWWLTFASIWWIDSLFEIKMPFFSRGLILILKWGQGIGAPLLTFWMIVIFLVIWERFCGENDSHFKTIVTAKSSRNSIISKGESFCIVFLLISFFKRNHNIFELF